LWEKGHEIRQRKDGALAGGLAAIGSDGFQFCQRHQLSKASFYYWRSKLEDAQGGRKSSFVSVRASVDPFPLASIHYPNGVRVDVFMPLDSDQIRKLAGC
jgi:hypothetical protein